MGEWKDEHIHLAMVREQLLTPLDFYTHKWPEALQADVDRTRKLPLAVFLRALGYENLGEAQVDKLRKNIGGIAELMRWAAPGGYRVVKNHDLGQDTLVRLRDMLRDNQDLIEALLEELEVT